MSWWSALISPISNVVQNWQKGKMTQEENRHTQEMAALNQFANEFGHGRTWFDSLIDGLNRLPRPAIVIMMIAYIFSSWQDPEQFSKVTAGLALIPDPMWAIIGIIVTFFFGAREFQLNRKNKGFAIAAKAAAEIASRVQTPIEWLRQNYPSVQLKRGVDLNGLDIDKMRPVIDAAQKLYHSRGVPLVITSALDGKHSNNSLHYEGLALDFRTRTLSDPKLLADTMSKALGDEYDVVLEKDHLHVEYDPKNLLGF